MNPAQRLDQAQAELQKAIKARDKADGDRRRATCRYRTYRLEADEAMAAYVAGEVQWSAVVEARAKRNKAAGIWGRAVASTEEAGREWWRAKRVYNSAVRAHERDVQRVEAEQQFAESQIKKLEEAKLKRRQLDKEIERLELKWGEGAQ